MEWHTLWIMRIDGTVKGAVVQAIDGVRAAGRALGDEELSSVQGARDKVDAFTEAPGPLPLVSDTDLEQLTEAMSALVEDSNRVIWAAIDPSSEMLTSYTPDDGLEGIDSDLDEDERFLIERIVSRTAVALTALAQGEPNRALLFARVLETATEDDLYTAVQDHILETFPPAE